MPKSFLFTHMLEEFATGSTQRFLEKPSLHINMLHKANFSSRVLKVRPARRITAAPVWAHNLLVVLDMMKKT